MELSHHGLRNSDHAARPCPRQQRQPTWQPGTSKTIGIWLNEPLDDSSPQSSRTLRTPRTLKPLSEASDTMEHRNTLPSALSYRFLTHRISEHNNLLFYATKLWDNFLLRCSHWNTSHLRRILNAQVYDRYLVTTGIKYGACGC